MRYNAQQVEQLAAEFVLGTLQGAARRRFESLITERADVRFEVWRWERHLNGLASGIRPCQPPRRVWKNIQRRIESQGTTKMSARGSWRGFWLALPTAVAAAWLAVTFLPAPSTDRVAVFADQSSAAMWVISADLDQRLLQLKSINAPALASENSYELWILPAEGPPLSLGLLEIEPGSVEIPLSVQLAAALEDAGSLAISLEPSGGSPTGLPTGPVVYQASLVTI